MFLSLPPIDKSPKTCIIISKPICLRKEPCVTKKTVKRIAFALASLLLLPPLLALIAHIAFFDLRSFRSPSFREGTEPEILHGTTEHVTFPAIDGKALAGYYYLPAGVVPKGLIVFAHGYGNGGHRLYLDLIDAFVARGYAVFAYDITGTDASEGIGVQGLPRGVADLDAALTYVRADERTRSLPLFLMGHSWGGYSVGAVLNLRQDVDAVVSFAGFDRPSGAVAAWGNRFFGPAAHLLVPYMTLIDRIRFGKLAELSALSGYQKATCPAMILHGAQDTTVPAEDGYLIFEQELRKDPRFTFKYMENRDHYNLWYATAPIMNDTLLDEIDAFLWHRS